MCVCVCAGIAALPTGLHPLEFSISETSSDTIVGRVECLNPISTEGFSIEEGVPFQLPFQLVQIGSTNVANLERTSELDYETGPSEFQFVVSCSDTDGDVTGTVTVTVLPENEFEPSFVIVPTVITIEETAPEGTVVASQGSDGLTQIIASDRDRGEDGQLTFQFVPGSDESFTTAHFSINETDGTILLKTPLNVDADFTTSADLAVVVCDTGRSQNTCPLVTMIVFIISVNEFDPQFSQPSYSTSDTSYPEGDYTSLVIATVECSDPDTGVGAFKGIELQLHSLAPELAQALGVVSPAAGRADVVLNGTLDFDAIREAEVQIVLVCSDDGDPARQDTATITLSIQDLDDNLPELNKDTYTVLVPETLSVGEQVLPVQCSDGDYGAGALDELQLLGEDSRMFQIDAVSGSISLAQSLDYESGLQSYEFTVLCKDSAGNEASASVNVNVQGVNDEPVLFTKTKYEFSVNRLELPQDVEVGQVETRDNDRGQQEPTRYSIEDNPNFRIDSEGRILLKDFIFSLEGDVFRLKVTASDGVNADATATVKISVEGPLSVLDIVLIVGGALVLALIIGGACGCYCLVKWRRNRSVASLKSFLFLLECVSVSCFGYTVYTTSV